MTPVRAPRCPGCDALPQPLQLLGIAIEPYFCPNDDCKVVSWDPHDDPAQFKAKSIVMDLPDLS